MEESISCRVQYVDDSDPFATTSSSHLEPSRPIMHTFLLHQSIGDQIPEVIRVLRAPHKVCDYLIQFDKFYLHLFHSRLLKIYLSNSIFVIMQWFSGFLLSFWSQHSISIQSRSKLVFFKENK